MTSERDFDRIARAWLDLGPDAAPDRAIDSVLQAIETTPQVRRPIRWPFWRPTIMTRLPVLAALAGGGVVVAVGLFAVGEVMYAASRHHLDGELIPSRGSLWMTREEWGRSWKAWLRGAAIGFPLGALPAGGAEIPTFLSYAVERRLTRHPEQFGHGAIEGVAGPEAANNAAAAGTLVPLLALGLPTTATAAILLAAFQQYGLQPGPLLFQHEPRLVWGLIASLYIGNVMLLVLNLPLVGLWVKLLSIPKPALYAGILTLASAGAYSVNRSAFDVGLLYAIGAVGYVMRCRDIPLAPAIIGLILGPMAEQQLRRALAIAEGSPAVLVTRPLSAALLAFAAALLVAPALVQVWKARGSSGR